MQPICDRCLRRGLPLLGVLYTAVPTEAAADLPTLSGNFGAGVTDKKLQRSTYALRGLPPGYVYLKCGRAWRGYLIDAAGYPRYYPDLGVEDMPSVIPAESNVLQCARQGRSHTGIEALCIEFPDMISGPVYIAYSRHKWTKAVRKQLAADPAARMQPIPRLDGAAFEHAVTATPEHLRQWVADFNLQAVAAINRHLPENARLSDRSALADSLVAAMRGMSGELNTSGLIMALHDPIGLPALLNHRRNAVAEQVLLLDQKTAEAEREDLLVAGVIEDLREGLQQNGGDWPRHEKHLDPAKFNAARKKLAQRRQLATNMEALSSDYLAWMTGAATQAAFEHDFDPQDAASGLALETWFAACTVGTGTLPQERDRLWQPWFDQPADAQSNLLWRAATANDPSVLAYVAWGKVDKTFDAAKGAKDIFKETPWYEHAQEALAARAQRQAQQRAYGLATEKIAQTLAAQLLWLRGRDPKKFLRTTAQMATVLMVRGDLVLLPKTLRARVSHYIRWQQEAWLGKPTVKAPLRVEPVPNRFSKRVDPSQLASDELRREVQSLHGALMVDLSGKDGVLAFTTWAAARLQPGEAPDETLQKLLRRLKLQPADLTVSADFRINPLSEDALNVRSAKLDRAFSVGTAFVQFIALFNTASELSDELKKGQDADSLKVNSAVAGILGACATVIAASMEIKAAGNIVAAGGTASLGTRLLQFGGAAIGLGVGLTDAYYLKMAADKLAAEGDKDAAVWTRFASGATTLSAVCSFVAGAGAAFSLISGVGLAVFVIAALAFGIASLIFGFQAGKATHTELEKWLDRSRFGRRERPDSKSRFKDLEAEMAGLRAAIYTVAVSIKHLGDMATLRGFIEAAVPFYAATTKLKLQVWGRDPWGRDHLLTQTDFAGETSLPKEVADRQAVASSHLSMQLQDKTLRLSGEVLVRCPPASLYRDDKGQQFITVGSVPHNVSDVRYFQSLRVVVTYQPDTKAWPEFTVEAKA